MTLRNWWPKIEQRWPKTIKQAVYKNRCVSISDVREVTFAATGETTQRLSTIEYTAIGIASVLLALIYFASVSLYLHRYKARRKTTEEPEIVVTGGRDGAGVVKNNPLLVTSRHFESDTNSGHSDDDLGEEAQSDGEHGFENVWEIFRFFFGKGVGSVGC